MPLRTNPDVRQEVTGCSFYYYTKTHEGHEEGIYIGAEYTILCFVLDH
jgi:hypothetical protein